MNGSDNLPVGPGIWGFIAFFVLAVALWLLVRNMNSRLRRMAYSDRSRAQAAEREAGSTAQDRTTGDSTPDSAADATRDGANDGGEDGPAAAAEGDSDR